MVEWKSIAELGTYFGGLTGKTKKDFEDGNAHFITYMNVFSNPNLDVLSVGSVHINEGEKQNKIQKGDILFTGSSETPDESGMSCVVTEDLNEDYYMNSFCFGLRLNDYEQYDLHYFKHIFRSYAIRQEISKTASGVTRFNISKAKFSKIQIPIPSKSEQEHIVSILDTFTSSIANLKEQIKERRKQYEHYRDQLLDLEGKEGVEMKTLGEVAQYYRGVTYNKKQEVALNSGGIKVLRANNITLETNSLNFDDIKEISQEVKVKDYQWLKADDVLICAGSGSKEHVGKVAYIKDDISYVYGGFMGKIVSNNVLISRYLFHVISSQLFKKYLDIALNSTTINNLNADIVNNFQIPIPSKSEQERIVSILDTFTSSIANLKEQIKEREKQYEYYRNQLLTFE